MSSATSFVGALQSANQFDEVTRQAHRLFAEQQAAATHHHQALRSQSTLHFEQHATLSRTMYDQSTFQQDALAVKECMRDLWQQKNEICQGRVICATLMFGCCFSTVSDGFPQLPACQSLPGNDVDTCTSRGAMVLLSIALPLAIGSLLTTVLLTLLLYRRLSRYDVDRPLRRYASCGHTHREFWGFYHCQCDAWERRSRRVLYGGILLTVVSILTLQALKYAYVYQALWALETVLLVVLASTVVVVTVGHLVYGDDTIQRRQPTTRR